MAGDTDCHADPAAAHAFLCGDLQAQVFHATASVHAVLQHCRVSVLQTASFSQILYRT